MIAIGITQRSTWSAERGERRTELDARWPQFLAACGLLTVPLPNDPALALEVCDKLQLAGAVLSGGDDLVPYGGNDPERDATERALLDRALERSWPLLGVCRGMQAVMNYFGGELVPVAGHVAARHRLTGTPNRTVNSYHHLAALEVPKAFTALAYAGTVVEAARHSNAPVHAVMWHPERESPFDVRDIAMFHDWFSGQ